jgi:hypothetical protein
MAQLAHDGLKVGSKKTITPVPDKKYIVYTVSGCKYES